MAEVQAIGTAGTAPGVPVAPASRAASVERRARALVRLAGLALPPALAAVLVPFRSSFSGTDAALVMVVGIVAVASTGDRLVGVLAAASSGLWFDFFLTRPYERFAIVRSGAVETTVLLFLVGLAITELTAWGRRSRAAASERGAHLEELHAVARMMAEEQDAAAVLARVEATLATLLELRECHYDREEAEPSAPALSQDGDVLLGGLRWNWLLGREVSLPVRFQGRRYGRFVLVPTPGASVSRERRMVAASLADEVAAVLASQAA